MISARPLIRHDRRQEIDDFLRELCYPSFIYGNAILNAAGKLRHATFGKTAFADFCLREV